MIEFIRPSWEFITEPPNEKTLKHLEKIGRVCYQSEDKMSETSTIPFIGRIMENAHYSILEQTSLTVKITCSRACLAQLSRHRHFSLAVESQRYVDYSKTGFKVIIPNDPKLDYELWKIAIAESIASYQGLRFQGVPPQTARGVLPMDMATDIIIAGNLRAWRDMFKLRCAKHAQTEIRELMTGLKGALINHCPILWG